MNKFNEITPASLSRKQEMELVENEFNDPRKTVIRRLFDQTALYNELFDKNRIKFSDTALEYALNKELNDYIGSIEKAKLKVEEGMPSPFNDIFGSYSKLVSSLRSYISSDKTKTADINVWLTSIRESGNLLDQLLTLALNKKVAERNMFMTPDPSKNVKPVDDKEIINLWLLQKQVSSGYNIHQLETVFKSYDTLPKTERTRLDNILLRLKSGENVKESQKYITDKEKRRLGVKFEADLRGMTPDVIRQEIARLELQKKLDIEKLQKEGNEIEGSYRPLEMQKINDINTYYDRQITTYKKILDRLRQRNPEDYYIYRMLPPLRRDQLPALRPREPEALTRENILPAEYVNLLDSATGSGAYGGQAGYDMARVYRIAEQWQNFPYYVPPNNPVVRMVNPRSRVNINTEGAGNARGGVLPLLAARVLGKKLLGKVGKKVAKKAVKNVVEKGLENEAQEGGFLPMLAARVVGKKLLGKVGKKVAKNAVENAVENEGGFLPMLAARVVGKKLLGKVGKKVAKNAVENAVSGDGRKKAKKSGKPKYDVI
jgi:hypothetical protein